MAADTPPKAPHVPVLLRPLLEAVAPVRGTWVDGTFGAGGYARGLLEAGAERGIGIDRDPLAHQMAEAWVAEYPGLDLVQANFADMDDHVTGADGVVLDLGVSSMQLDRAERGFSFQKDGPLDMRMEQAGESAADLVKRLDETTLANVLYTYGEERASRRIAKAIVKARAEEPIETTRSFQALRIAVNDEYGALWRGLMAAERALKPGGWLAVVTFHSVEDRMVKRFMQARAGRLGSVSRHAPEQEQDAARFVLITRKAVGPDDEELAQNPRSRSARLRVAQRTEAAAGDIGADIISMPQLRGKS